jgi:hypothetical protein
VAVASLVRTVEGWLASGGGLLADAGGRFDVQLLLAGLALHLLADLVRNNGWFSVLRAARPDDVGLRRRDVQAAAFGGRGVNAVLPARAGDAVKIALLRRRAPNAPIATLAATLVPETLFELCVGLALLTWALTAGYLPVDAAAGALSYAGDHAAVALVVAVGAVTLAIVVAGRMRRRCRARRLVRDLAAGFAILGRPRDFLAGVVSWQLAARLIRLAAIMCCLAACGLPSAPAAAALAMAVEGGTRLRFAPATTGLRVGLLLYGLAAATGTAVSLGPLIAYTVGVRSIRTVISIGLAVVVLCATLGTRSPRRALDLARRAAGRGPAAGAAPEPLPARPPAGP